MGNILNLKFTTNPLNSITGEIQSDTDFGKVLDGNFDNIPLKGNKNYSLYNQILIDIRDSRRKNTDTIEVSKSDLESLRKILIDSTENVPALNRIVSFLISVIDDTIKQEIIAESTHS